MNDNTHGSGLFLILLLALAGIGCGVGAAALDRTLLTADEAATFARSELIAKDESTLVLDPIMIDKNPAYFDITVRSKTTGAILRQLRLNRKNSEFAE